jgi:hypothetical protein
MTDRPLRNTRRTFLASSALGALSAVATGGAAAEAGGAVEPTATVEGWRVGVDDWGSARGARAVFRDGSFVEVNAGDPDRFGAPGRVVESVTFTDHDGTTWTMDNGAPDADLGPRAVTFTDARTTVRESQFADLDTVPGNEISRVELHFVDGTSEVVHSYDGPAWPASLPGVYRGSGAHAGNVVEAIDISYDLNVARHYVRNPAADKHLLGKETPQERLVEVMGATEGAVDYEFTVDGTVRPIRNAGPRRSTAGNDEGVDDGDGTVTVSGFTGNTGYGDTYAVTGDVTDFTRTGGSAAVRIDYNGHERAPEELVARH